MNKHLASLLLLFAVSARGGHTFDLHCEHPGQICNVAHVRNDLTREAISFDHPHPEQVLKVEIKDIQLGQIPIAIFGRFRNAKILHLDRCSLTSLRGIYNAPWLTELRVNGNRIPRIESTTFNGARALETLNLARNEIAYIHEDAFIHLGNLSVLDLSFNHIHEIGKNLFRGAQIYEVNLRGNRISEVEERFNSLRYLEVLNLAHNRISTISSATFGHSRRLQKLHLNNNKIRTIDLNAFYSNPVIEILDLAHNQIHRLQLRLSTPFIRHLMANHNEISEELAIFSENSQTKFSYLNAEWNQIEGFQIEGTISIESLKLAHNKLKTVSDIPKVRKVKVLDISDNPLGDADFSSLAKMGTLGQLNISHCDITNINIVPILRANSDLWSLDLSYNSVYVSAWPSFAYIPSLSWLYLNGIQLDYLNPYELKSVAPKLRFIYALENRFNCTYFEQLEQRFDSMEVKIESDCNKNLILD